VDLHYFCWGFWVGALSAVSFTVADLQIQSLLRRRERGELLPLTGRRVGCSVMVCVVLKRSCSVLVGPPLAGILRAPTGSGPSAVRRWEGAEMSLFAIGEE